MKKLVEQKWSSYPTSFHLPLARGQNVRLAAKLTGWKIDIEGAGGDNNGSFRR